MISNWWFAFETATVDFRGKRWFPLSNATKINFYSLMKGAFSASRKTGSVSRHYPSTLITFYPLPGRNWTCGTYAPGVTTAMLVYPKKQTSPKGTARVKGREVETISRITCFINFTPRFDIIVRVVSIAQIVAKYEPRLSRRLYGNHALQTRKGRGFEADFFFILSIALSLETVTRTFVSFRFKFYSHWIRVKYQPPHIKKHVVLQLFALVSVLWYRVRYSLVSVLQSNRG